MPVGHLGRSLLILLLIHNHVVVGSTTEIDANTLTSPLSTSRSETSDDFDSTDDSTTEMDTSGTEEWTDNGEDNQDLALETITSTVEVTTTTAEELYACPEHFKQLTIDWCFHFRYNTEKGLLFKDAQQYCNAMDGILPAITSVDVTTALMLERTKLGISPFEVFFIDLGCDRKTHKWYWIDGPPYDPSDAFFRRLTILGGSEYCYYRDQPFVFDQFGTWEIYNHNNPLPLVLCAVRPMGYSPPSPLSEPCTETWTQLPGGLCYALIVQPESPLNVYDAEMLCRKNGGHLPSILSSEQTNLIQAYLTGKQRQNSQFWIGLYCYWNDTETTKSHDRFTVTGRRAWIDGSPYNDEYSNFLESDDDTESCNMNIVEPFLYNAALKGKWQKEGFDTALNVVMCTRVDPEPLPPSHSSTVTTTKTTTTTRPLQTTRESQSEPVTTEPFNPTDQQSSTEPEESTGSIVTTTIITTVITTTTTLPTTSVDRPRPLTTLELVLIVSIVIIFILVLLCMLLYFICRRIKKGPVQDLVNNMQKRFSRANTHALVRTDEWEIRRQFVGIDYSRQLGRGAFGSVYLGRVYSGNIPELAVRTLLQLNTLKKEDDFVAVKTLHETADRQAMIEFMEEINIMKKIGFHERLVNILACVTETEPLLLIVEYCSNGDLLNFMRERRQFMLKLAGTVGEDVASRHSVITHKQQLMFGIQIAYGMEYLSQHGFVHRDLAARNILVDKNESCKIGDFGLCRQVGTDNEQYLSRGGRLPWRWMAPEALENYLFSVESDVWSFGVLLFEVITLGGNPYPDWPAVELLHRLKSGERMPKPEGCSEGFYKIMKSCWRGIPSARLPFEQLRRQIALELEESSGDDYYLKLDASAKYYQETVENDNRRVRFNSF